MWDDARVSSGRPVIGISAYSEQARWGVWDLPAVLVPLAYVSKVEQAGGIALVIPPGSASSPELVERLDGLILAGGPDLDPGLYGALAHPETANLRPDRDAGERTLAAAAIAADLPTLGICRGMQLLAVLHGGKLDQHLPETVGHEGHRPALGVFGEHEVALDPGTIVHSTLGSTTKVKSYHHQGVSEPGSLTVSARADDGVIEGVEVPGNRFAVGVLWHPEAGEDPRLFDALIAAAQLG